MIARPTLCAALAAALCAFVTLHGAAAAQQQQPTPRPGAPRTPSQPATRAPVAIDPPLVDFGVVAPGSKHPATFTIRNMGSVPIKVAKALPSCKCTDITPIDGQVIQPGGSLQVSAALSVPRSPGEKEAKVMISFEGYQGMHEAKMKGDVTLPVKVAPAYLDALKGNLAGTLQLSSVDGKPFRVLSAGGKPPVLAAGSSDAAAPAHQLSWNLAGVAPEAMQQWWLIETDREDCPIIPVRVRHDATGARFDMARMQRFWFPPESVIVAGRVKAGSPVEIATTIEHLNPAAQGRVTEPEWGKVIGATVPGGEGTAEVVSATKRGEDFVDVVLRFTPRADLRGVQYVPVHIQTATGSGPVFVAAVVVP